MPKATFSNITAEIARAILIYDPIDGTLIKRSTLNQLKGLTIKLCGELRETSRVIWLLHYGVWPPLNMLVDHEDRNRRNWKIENLRLANYSQNGCNSDRHRPYGENCKGVTMNRSRSKIWHAQIRIEGRKVNLGRYHTKEEAIAAYRNASELFHKEFSCV